MSKSEVGDNPMLQSYSQVIDVIQRTRRCYTHLLTVTTTQPSIISRQLIHSDQTQASNFLMDTLPILVDTPIHALRRSSADYRRIWTSHGLLLPHSTPTLFT